MKKNITSIIFLIIALLLSSLDSYSQTDFTGKWQFNKAGSSPGLMYADYDGTVIRQIIQDTDSIKYNDIYIKPGNNDWETAKEVFSLSGKEEINKGEDYIIKKSTKWGEGKNSITLIYVHTQEMNGVPSDFRNEETYRTSDDGKSLTIETYSKDPVQGEKRTKSFYIKK